MMLFRSYEEGSRFYGAPSQLPPVPAEDERLYPLPMEKQGPCGYGRWNGCKHLRDYKLPAGHRAKRKAKRKAQRAARKGK